MSITRELADHIAGTLGVHLLVESARSVGGGSINSGFRVSDTTGLTYFLKLNTPASLEMFDAEREGLQALGGADCLKVPQPLACGVAGDSAFLMLEWLELSGHDRGALESLGQGLAQLHRVTGDRFGWHRHNTIGSTPQINKPDVDWVRFYRERRLKYQLEQAAANGYGGKLQEKGERLLEKFPQLFAAYNPRPSLLHGDLWGGNWGVTADGQPAIFDPAVYFGDREADLAMTRLFGGFGPEFYRAYQAAWPLDDGFDVRQDLYNLYHVLNHLNLFGGGYLAQAERMADKLLAELDHC
jgi:fructosamine-3-kinase